MILLVETLVPAFSLLTKDAKMNAPARVANFLNERGEIILSIGEMPPGTVIDEKDAVEEHIDPSFLSFPEGGVQYVFPTTRQTLLSRTPYAEAVGAVVTIQDFNGLIGHLTNRV